MSQHYFSFFNFLDDLSPPPLFYLTFLVENQAGATLKLITSDNDPPDGFKLEPEHSSVITKEVINPSDLSIHAVVPGAEKTLLVNGQSRIVVAPSKITGDPMLLRVTGKDGKSTLDRVVREPLAQTSRADLDFCSVKLSRKLLYLLDRMLILDTVIPKKAICVCGLFTPLFCISVSRTEPYKTAINTC